MIFQLCYSRNLCQRNQLLTKQGNGKLFVKDPVSWVFEDPREYRLGLGPSQFKQNSWSGAEEEVETRVVTGEVWGHPGRPSGFLLGLLLHSLVWIPVRILLQILDWTEAA